MKKLIIFSLLVIIFLSGCAGVYFQWDDVRKLKAGMTKQEVINIVGKPYSVSVINTTEGPMELWIWVFVDPSMASRSFSIKFKEGILVNTPMVPDDF